MSDQESKELIEFSELWWNDVIEGEPIAQDEIELAKDITALAKSQQQLIDQLTTSVEYWQADAKRLDVSNIRKQGFIDQQAKEYAEERAAHNLHVTELLQVEAIAKIAIKALEEMIEEYKPKEESKPCPCPMCGALENAISALEEIKRLKGEKL